VVLQRDSTRRRHTAAPYIGVADQIGEAVGSAATWINTTGLTAEQTTTAVSESGRSALGWCGCTGAASRTVTEVHHEAFGRVERQAYFAC